MAVKTHRYFIFEAALVLLAAIFYIQIASLKNDLTGNTSDGLIRRTNTATQEMFNAMAWLKQNSQPGDVVLAPQKLGHTIMAFADRPVIVSTKIYPSEVPEVAERFRDLARFLFARDIGDAMRVVDKYQVKFVVVDRDMEFGICEEADACHFVGGDPRPGKKRELNPEGRKRTMLGWLQEKSEVPGFAKIWSSNRFDIWRVTSLTRPALCEVTDEEKRVILSGIRETFTSGSFKELPGDSKGILSQRCNLSVWAAIDGVPLAQSIITGQILSDAIRIVSNELHVKLKHENAAMPSRIRFVVSLWHDGQVYPINSLSLTQPYPNSILRGYRYGLADNPGRYYYFFPFEANSRSFGSAGDLRRYLCGRAQLNDECLSGTGNTLIWAFPISTFAEGGSTETLVDFAGPLPLKEAAPLNNELLKTRLAAALEWFLRTEREYEANMGGNAPFSALVLADGFEVLGDQRYRSAAEKILSSWGQKVRDNKYASAQDIGYAMLASLVLGNRNAADEYARQLAAFTKQNDDTSRFIFDALARYYSVTKNENAGRTLKEMRTAIGDKFLYDHIANYDTRLNSNAVLVSAFEALYGVTHEDYDATMAINVARWLLEYQNPVSAAGFGGSFWASPKSRYVSTYNAAKSAKALMSAEKIARALGGRYDLYAEGIESAINWLLSMQYVGDNAMQLVSAEDRGRYFGGIRTSVENPEPSFDSTGHFIMALARYLKQDLL